MFTCTPKCSCLSNYFTYHNLEPSLVWCCNLDTSENRSEVSGKFWYRELKEEALDTTLWRTRFGRGYGPVVRQITEWMNVYANFIGHPRCRAVLGRSDIGVTGRRSVSAFVSACKGLPDTCVFVNVCDLLLIMTEKTSLLKRLRPILGVAQKKEEQNGRRSGILRRNTRKIIPRWTSCF